MTVELFSRTDRLPGLSSVLEVAVFCLGHMRRLDDLIQTVVEFSAVDQQLQNSRSDLHTFVSQSEQLQTAISQLVNDELFAFCDPLNQVGEELQRIEVMPNKYFTLCCPLYRPQDLGRVTMPLKRHLRESVQLADQVFDAVKHLYVPFDERSEFNQEGPEIDSLANEILDRAELLERQFAKTLDHISEWQHKPVERTPF